MEKSFLIAGEKRFRTMISGIAHVNLTIPSGGLEAAREFYAGTLGFTPRPVPQLQKDTLAWFDIGTSGQQVHIAIGAPTDFQSTSSRHPCFKLQSPEALLELRRKIWEHFQRGGDGAPKAADKPGEEDSGEFELILTNLLLFGRALLFNNHLWTIDGGGEGTSAKQSKTRR